MQENIKLKGSVLVVQYDRDDKKAKQVYRNNNLIVDTGRYQLASLFASDGTFPAPTHVAVGTSTTAPAVGQTALQGTELERIAFTSVNRDQAQVTFEALFDGTWTGTVEEAGLFNASSGGDMSARFLTGTFDKGSNDNILIVWGMEVQLA